MKTIHHATEISSSGTHVSSRQDPKSSHFWPEVMTKNGAYHFYPSAKSRRDLKIKTLEVIFGGASAYYVQKAIAPQKQAACRSDETFFDENFSQKTLPFFLFRRRKMKCRGSCETHFPKVWGQTEPSSGGKQAKFAIVSICCVSVFRRFSSCKCRTRLEIWQ